MFRASICPSSGVLGCIRVMLLHMLNTIWSSLIRIQPNTPEDGHIDARNM